MGISEKNKEHVKKLTHDFLDNEEYRKQRPGYIAAFEMRTALCAAHGKFDFSVVLEHFSELIRAVNFAGNPMLGTLSWRQLAVHYFAYCLLNVPMLKSELNDKIDWFLFQPRHDYNRKNYNGKPKYFPPVKLSSDIRRSIDENKFDDLCRLVAASPDKVTFLKNVVYTVLTEKNWKCFAELYKKFDISSAVDMECVFEYWRRDILNEYYEHGQHTASGAGFLEEWKDKENFPLHRMIVQWDTTGRCIPVLFRQGLLFPEIQNELWQMGIPFTKPLCNLKGWEQVTFQRFSAYFAEFANDFACCNDMPQHGEKVFLNNLIFADFYQKELAAKKQKSMPENKKSARAEKSNSLTEEQKKQLENEIANGVIFSNNDRTLKEYPWQADTVRQYIVPDFVTAISPEAFSGSEKLKHIVLPEGLKKIGRGAFFLSKVQKVDFPTSLTVIGEGAFDGAESLKEVILPDTVVEICAVAFGRCDRLKRVEIPEGCKVSPTAFLEHHKDLQIIYRKKAAEQG